MAAEYVWLPLTKAEADALLTLMVTGEFPNSEVADVLYARLARNAGVEP